MRFLFSLTLILATSLWTAATADTTTTSTTTSELTFTSLTNPLPLYPGEVTNTWHHIDIPPGPIAISEFAADIVEQNADGEYIPVPLSDAYLHHHVVYSSDDSYKHHKHRWSKSTTQQSVNRGVGFGAGTESRGTRQVFPYPYRFTTIQGEDELVANVHVINTRSMSVTQARQCLECPCTQEDYAPLVVDHHWHWPWSSSKKSLNNRDITAPTKLSTEVIGRRHHWDRCNAQLRNESNSACSPDDYRGGLICCEHGEFCLDEYFLEEDEIPKADKKTLMRAANPKINETQSVFYLRYTLTYEPLTPKNTTDIKPLYLAACCDATGNLTSSGNIEYDIPKLCDDDNETASCIHTLETVQALHGASSTGFGVIDKDKYEEKWVDVVYMVGHLHRGGLEMSAYYNNTLLCKSTPRYGTGKPKEIGNEPGYINAMSACKFDPPRRMKTTDQLRIVGKYNASQAHTGVMSLFYIALADVEQSSTEKSTTKESTGGGGFFGRFQRLATLIALGIVVVATMKVFKKHRHHGYEQVGSGQHAHNLVV